MNLHVLLIINTDDSSVGAYVYRLDRAGMNFRRRQTAVYRYSVAPGDLEKPTAVLEGLLAAMRPLTPPR